MSQKLGKRTNIARSGIGDKNLRGQGLGLMNQKEEGGVNQSNGGGEDSRHVQ